MKLSETSFAQKLARAPRVPIAIRVNAANEALAGRHDEFTGRILGLVDEIAAISAARADCARLVANASEIAGVAGLLEQAETARIASWLAQMGDEMPADAIDWSTLDIFCRALQLLSRPGQTFSPTELSTLLAQLDSVRATVQARGEHRERNGHEARLDQGER